MVSVKQMKVRLGFVIATVAMTGCVKGTGVCADGQTVHPVSGLCETWCGDGVVGTGEECDDGDWNADEGDVCRTNCRVPRCGDGIIDTGEECDDGADNANAPNKCRMNCRRPSCGDGIPDDGEACSDGSYCGDGVVDDGEECDDGALNANAPDACRINCRAPYCGDGIKDGDEECDNGGLNSPTPDACRPGCLLPKCGDGIKDSGEQCDDGNTQSKDGCSSTCKIETNVSYEFTGAVQKYVVPEGVYEVELEAMGASGYGAFMDLSTTPATTWGLGGWVRGRLAVLPGDTLWIYVGQEGQLNGWAYNGGAGIESGRTVGMCAGGGGASDVRVGGQSLAHRVIVGAGGGGTAQASWSKGGFGGGAVGGSGTVEQTGALVGNGGGQTGPEVRFGVGLPCGYLGFAGPTDSVGAGGGGWYGGGTGTGGFGAGGGGSSYIGGVINGEYLQDAMFPNTGVKHGNGRVRISAIW